MERLNRNLSSSPKPKKRFSQNFLQQEKYINELVAAAGISPNDTVLEIGPGLGVITEKLAKTAKRVVAVELDHDLIPQLHEKFKENNNVEIINDDILHFLSSNFQLLTSNFKIIGSLPYQITSPLLHQLANFPGWSSAVLLIQKEVAEKIAAAPPKATYLSNFVKVWADVKLVGIVPKEAFFPAPKVDGAIIKMTHKPEGFAEQSLRVGSEEWSTFLHRGFAHPRQMLNKVFSPETLNEAGVDPRRRPATLTLTEWQELYWTQRTTEL